MRPLCSECKILPCAINYQRKGITYYRKRCEACSRKARKEKIHKEPRWALAGYKPKSLCEKCGFKPTLKGQLAVFHIDGDMQNISARNLKTVCLNCNFELSVNGWVHGDLQEDP